MSGQRITIYVSGDELEWLRSECEKLDRGASWLIRRALKLLRADTARRGADKNSKPEPPGNAGGGPDFSI